jgi:hypothetical protein
MVLPTLHIPIGTQIIGKINYNNYTEIYFETLNSAIGLLPGQSVTLTCQEGKTVNTDRPDFTDPTTNKALPTASGTSSLVLLVRNLNLRFKHCGFFIKGVCRTGDIFCILDLRRFSIRSSIKAETVFTTRRLSSDGSILIIIFWRQY